MKVLVLVGLAISLATCDPQPIAVTVETKPVAVTSSIETSIRAGLRYVAEEGDRWMEGQAWVQSGEGCVSCHHVGYALWAQSEGERAGIRLVDSGFEELRRKSFAFQTGRSEIVPATQMILAGNYQEGDLDALASKSAPGGHWQAKGQFPAQRRGEHEGDAVATLWALVALDSLDTLNDALKARRNRALEWMSEAPDGVSTEWNAARLIVDYKQNGRRTGVLLEQLLAAQKDDGGWGWFEEDPSNPFSTGQSVYALSIVAPEGAASAVRRGVDYLLSTQQEDGTWLTSSKYTSEVESKDRDYIYQFWGTAWASMGLSRARGPASENASTAGASR